MKRELSRSEIFGPLAAAGLVAVALATGHSREVDVFIAVSLVTGFLVEPLLIFIHELAHAAAVVACSGQRVLVRIGREPYLVRFAIGRIDVRLHPTGYVAHCELSSAHLSPRRHGLIALAGPLASISVGVALIPVAFAWQSSSTVLFWVATLAAISSLLLGIGNAVPFHRLPAWWPGSPGTSAEEGPSDGLVALWALRRHRNPRADSTAGEPEAVPTPPKLRASEQALRVLTMAEEEARSLGAPYLGTEHLLLGLLRERDGRAAGVLEELGLSTDVVRPLAGRVLEGGEGGYTGPLPLTPTARRTLERAGRSLSLQGDGRVDTQHVLLGLAQEPGGLAAQLISDLGIDPSDVRRRAIRALREGTPRASSAD